MVEENPHVHREPAWNDQRFIVSLIANRNRQTLVRSCQIKGHSFNDRASFGEGATLRQAFSAPFVRALESCLEKLSFKIEVQSLPDFLYEVEGLTLRGIHVMSTRLADGAINIIMRFLSFVGGINHALAPETGFDDPVQEEGQAIAASVLEDITTLLLNISSSAVLGLRGTNDMLGASGQKIARQTDEIQFRRQLLRRYVERRSHRLALAPHEILTGLQDALTTERRRRLV
ncbi:hypothetical protein [Sulfitobacter sp. JB4-11]|uniref:hypothetical protein n=1 Tax=Sulfitobacter rhodophyticola TaxID=3238304 RepID=UPI00351762E0